MGEGLLASVLSDANSPIRNTNWFKQFVVANVPDTASAKQDLLDNGRVRPEQRLQHGAGLRQVRWLLLLSRRYPPAVRGHCLSTTS